MTTLKFRILFSFLLLAAFSWVIPLADQKFSQLYPIVTQGHARPFDWTSILPNKTDRLKRTIDLIKEDYVDPPRIKPEEMLKKTLDQLALSIPEVRVSYEGEQRALLLVGSAKKEIDLRIPTLSVLPAVLEDLQGFVSQNKVSKIKDDDTESSIISAVLATLDPHSMFLSKDIYQETQVQTTGHFGGLGIVIGVRDSKLTIITPIEDTPASKSGFKAGDNIAKINEESTDNMPLPEAVKRMRGPIGTPVNITIVRKGWPSSQEFKLVRAKIVVVSVESHLLPNSIGYVKIKNFQQDTGKSLEAQLRSLETKAGGKLKGLVLDLRNNPGGVLDQAIDVSDQFLSKGAIVSTVGPNGVVYAREDAGGKGVNPTYPIVTIINHGSASASEIVAGALHGNQRSLILGTTSFGKGTVQRIYDLPKDSALKLTIAKYLTPGNISIQSRGIVPDVQTEPYIISKMGYNLVLKAVKPGESTLDKHFSAVKAASEPAVALPSLSMRYVEKIEDPSKDAEIEASNQNEEKIKKLIADFDVSLATKILSKTPSANVQEMIKTTSALQANIAKEQNDKLQEELKKQSIDWSLPNSPVKNGACPLQISFKLLKNKKVVSIPVAGEKVDLEVSVKNDSKCTLFRTLVQTESKRYFFDDLEFLIGKLSPQETVSKSMQVEIPKGMFSGNSEIDFSVLDSTLKVVSKTRETISIQTADMPAFAIHYEISDQNDSVLGKGNNNSVIEQNEVIRIKVDVENTGKVAVTQGSIDLHLQDGSGLEGKNVHSPIKNLLPKTTQSYNFYVRITKDAKKESASVRLNVIDFDYKVFQTREISLPLLSPLANNSNFLRPPSIQTDLNTYLSKKVPTQFIKVKGSAEDSDGLQDVYIIVNSKKAFYQPLKDKKASFETSIALEPGENQVLVVVRDKEDLLQTERFIIVREGNKAPLTQDEGETILE